MRELRAWEWLKLSPRTMAASATARHSGYFPVIRPAGDAPSTDSRRVSLVEAFPTPGEAERVADLLRSKGLNPRIIQR